MKANKKVWKHFKVTSEGRVEVDTSALIRKMKNMPHLAPITILDASQVPDELCKITVVFPADLWINFLRNLPDSEALLAVVTVEPKVVDLEVVQRRLEGVCERCGGTGHVPVQGGVEDYTCPKCNGSGHPQVPGVETK